MTAVTEPARPAPVQIIPDGKVVFGIQLPIQSQSTIYVRGLGAAIGPRRTRPGGPAGRRERVLLRGGLRPHRHPAAVGRGHEHDVVRHRRHPGLAGRDHQPGPAHVATSTSPAQRHPLRAAKEFATLDVLSGGRVIIGVGAGHVNEEFDLFGPPFDERGTALDEAIDAIAAALTDEFPTLAGPRWPATDLSVSPRPVQRPRPPIWVGGSSRPALRRAARAATAGSPRRSKRSGDARPGGRAPEFRAGAPRGRPHRHRRAWPGSSTSASPSWELPRGRSPEAPTHRRGPGRVHRAGGVALQMRFPTRSVEELCDQMAAFGEQVGPLLSRSMFAVIPGTLRPPRASVLLQPGTQQESAQIASVDALVRTGAPAGAA